MSVEGISLSKQSNEVTNMEIIKKKISKGQHLTEIYPKIETNTILCKTLTGLGATHSEIMADRNSIIVVPNIPVIKGKCEKHKKENLFGVKEGVDTDNVVDYIKEMIEKGKNIKIITTPESFYKIKNAFIEFDQSVEKECFILIDEAHKMIKDRDYRPNILFPMDDFFKAENKAMVSATPIIPSDPRFEQQKFKIVEIVPDFDYSQEIHLIHTNNVLQAFKRVQSIIEEQDIEQRSYCIFANSIDLIYQLIIKLGISDESSVFCSEKSVKKLKELKYKRAFPLWDIKHKSRYMFFTSRFYNALDIEMDEKPNVIFLTEPYIAKHSILDPDTDVVQALGRFRNGVNSAIHLYSTNSSLVETTKDEIKGYIKACEKTYNQIKVLKTSAQTLGETKLYAELLEVHPYNQFLVNGEKDYFAIDNYTDDELVKSDYGDSMRLQRRYENNHYFNIIEAIDSHFRFNDEDRLSLNTNRNLKKETRKKIVDILDNIKDDIGTSMFHNYVADLKEYDSFIVDAYFKLGSEVIKQCKYNTTKIRERLLLKEFNEKQNGANFLQALKNTFEVGNRYRLPMIKNELEKLYSQFQIKSPNSITAQKIKEFFDVDDKVRIGNSKAMLILSSKI